MDQRIEILRETNDRDLLEQIGELFVPYLPYRGYLYQCMKTNIAWKFDYGDSIQFYCLASSETDGSCVIVNENTSYNKMTLYALTLETSGKKLIDTLHAPHSPIDMTRINHICIVHEDLISTFLVTLPKWKLRLHHFILSRYWYLPETVQLEPTKPPEGTYLASLKPSNAEQINDLWPYKSENSLAYIERLIERNESVGLFKHGSDELCAWIMENDWGTLGLLYTEEEYRGHGFAKTITKALCNQMRGRNVPIIPFSLIVCGNKPSETLFENMGFEMVGHLSWLEVAHI